MTQLEKVFLDKKPKFIPYFSLGDPDFESSLEWARALIAGGADILELGIPFSDPTADGPVIQKAFKRAFEHNFSLEDIFNITARIHRIKADIPLAYLTYFNPIYHYGMDKFTKKAAAAGISGLIIPDLPIDVKESEKMHTAAANNGINIIHLVTPATNTERIEQMLSEFSGFIYYVTSYGVTGIRNKFANDLKTRIINLKKKSGVPVCAGFGISTPDQAKQIAVFADGVIIGSAIQRIIEECGSNQEFCAEKLKNYCLSIKESILSSSLPEKKQ